MEQINRRDLIKTGISAGLIAASGITNTKSHAALKPSSKPPNILWIMMDDARADALGCYGKPWARTPNMDRLAAQGIRFAAAVVQNPVCVPSRTSMKTSHYCSTCGITAMGNPPAVKPAYMKNAKPDLPNLLNAWKNIGIAPVNVGKTHAFQNDWLQKGDAPALVDFLAKPKGPEGKKKFDEAEDFDYRPVNIKTHRWMIGGIVPYAPEDTQTWRLGDLGVKALEELAAKDDPFFLRVSFHAPHVPCRVPKQYFIDPDKIDLPLPTEEELKSKPRFEREQLRIYAGGLDLTAQQIGICRGTYYGMVSLVDAQVARLIKTLKQTAKLDNTIIVINSDQGFQLGEHGLWKKRVLYDQNVCVPFILSCPAMLPQGKVIEQPVEMIDFIPTLMDLTGLDIPENIPGRSLMPLITGRTKQWKRAVFCEIDHSGSMYDELRKNSGRRVMVRTAQWKLIYFMDERAEDKDGALYNLKLDPQEKTNLYGDPKYAHTITRLEKLAEKWDRNRQT
ncbi:MAG: sulfatase-like hydrolase/transferase [Sedimentisphaerales bacterium]|nr:sulfatase-like hydrolase/transferase [Sedimentisphaerales bacterium]